MLHARLAAAYLRSGQQRLARIYVERICAPVYNYDDGFNKVKYPLRFDRDVPASDDPEVYAEVLLVAAQISLRHGKISEAREELDEASQLDLSNLEIDRLWKQTRKLYDSRRERRYVVEKHGEELAKAKYYGK